MAETVNLYGHEMELNAPRDGDGVVVDVIVLARTVTYDEEGHAEDTSLFSITGSTPSVVQLGLLHHATATLTRMMTEDDE